MTTVQSIVEKAKGQASRIPHGARIYFAVLGAWLATTAMHIPDGYLSPVFCAVMFAVMIPFWYFGLKKLRGKMNARSVPLIALLAAFSFIIMMFNVPLPGGTTGHAVGGALIAVLLGPEVAVVAVSIALIIQAVFFGDGGILAVGANCFNMAVVLPYISYAVYQAVAGKQPVDSPRRPLAAFLGGYLGLSAAAFFAGLEFGLQPALFHAADGTPLYAPYPLSVSLPAMIVPHILVASVIEGLVTALVLAYLQRTNRELVAGAAEPSVRDGWARLRILWVALAVLAFITPIGLLAPGTAWGEWGAEELTALGLGFIPDGLQRLGGIWSSPLPDYEIPALGNASLGYIISAVIGILAVSIVTWLFVTVLTGGRRNIRKGGG
jgi:cobalt/nickel transport system permease protein